MGRHMRRLGTIASQLRRSQPSAAEAAESSAGPLAGILVVEFTTAVQGPAAGQYLRDMGAEVIKIEGPSGDGNRHGRGTQYELFSPQRHSNRLSTPADDAALRTGTSCRASASSRSSSP